MLQIGTNLDGGWNETVWRRAGGLWGRWVSRKMVDQTMNCEGMLAAGRKPFCLMTLQSVREWPPAEHIKRYAGKVAAFAILNEIDGSGPSSDSCSLAEALDWVKQARAARDQYAPGTPLVAPSSVSGDPTRVDPAIVALCDWGDLHPYAKDAAGVVALLRQYQAVRPMLEWGIGEFGQPAPDGDPDYMASVVDAIAQAGLQLPFLMPYWPSPAARAGHVGGQTTGAEFVLGFQDRSAEDPAGVGLPLRGEFGVGPWLNVQPTTSGMLVYRRLDSTFDRVAARSPIAPPAPAPVVIWKGSPNFWESRPGAPLGICLHTMSGYLSGCDAQFANPAPGGDPSKAVSAHYAVGLNGEIHQYVKLSDRAWANGILQPGNAWQAHGLPNQNPNDLTVSIETEDRANAAEPVTDAQYAAVLSICRFVLEPYPSIKWLISHSDISPASRPDCCGRRWHASGRFAALAAALGLGVLG